MKKFFCLESAQSPAADPSFSRSRITADVPSNQTSSSRRSRSMDSDRTRWHHGECWDQRQILCVRWKVPIRYQELQYVGHGAFGVVMRAIDTKFNRIVAIKMLPRPTSREVNYKRIYREIKYLSYLSHWDSDVVQLYDVFTPESSSKTLKTVYLVLNFFDSDLSKRIQLYKSRGQRFSESEVQHIIHSILRAVKLLHSAGIIHRDIKPENIGITDVDNVGLLDFGLARAGVDGLKTGYVVTRSWRAPEVMTCWENYDEKIDIWSVGCVMAELLLLTRLFPANTQQEHLEQIIDLVGTPDPDTLNRMTDRSMRKFILDSKPNVPRKNFRGLFPNLSQTGIDFLQGLLRFDPKKRLTAEKALGHSFLSAKRHAESEMTKRVLHDQHRDGEYSDEQWKQLIWNLVQRLREPSDHVD